MNELVRSNRTMVAVWVGLMLATLLSWWLGSEESGDDPASAGVIAVLVVTFVKIRFVARHFMEVRDAPLALRVVIDAYIVVVGATLIVICLATA